MFDGHRIIKHRKEVKKMGDCCSMDPKSICSQFDCTCKETEKGVQIDLKPKDPAKAGSLKALLKACKDFCDCCK
jgi:hypothetical protein